MNENDRHWLRKQLGLTGGSPAYNRKTQRAKRPAWARPKRKPKQKSLGERARRWWKQHAPAWAGGKAAPKRRRKRRKAAKAARGAEFGPVVQAFLAGQSVRQATYLHRTSDPAVMMAADWPGQVAAAEAAIRASLLLTLDKLSQQGEEQ
jgi:hypothetical protein